MLYARQGFPATGAVDNALKPSREPLVSSAKVVLDMGQEHRPQSLQEYCELIGKLQEYQKDYAKYWESTKSLTGTGEQYKTPTKVSENR